MNVVATGSSVEREIEAVRAEVRRDIGTRRVSGPSERQDDRDRDFHRYTEANASANAPCPRIRQQTVLSI